MEGPKWKAAESNPIGRSMKKRISGNSVVWTGGLALLLLLAGCSQQKNTLLHRGWHNMNARYNGYFYSKDNMKETVKKVEKANKDDFTKMIPLYVNTTNENAKTYYGDFDKSLKKSSVVIQRHTIYTKKTKKEIPNACRWIDENYMLIGMAHYYKRDLFSALEAFEYVSKIYPNPQAKYSGMLWKVRTENEIGSLSESELLLDELRNAQDFPKDRSYQRDYAMVQADFHMKRGDYALAIKDLNKAIPLTKKKSTKARDYYVLAQLYEKVGDTKNASLYYGMVPGLHPVYDMVFSAQINQARLFDAQGEDTKDIKKKLNRMLRDDKNIEFQDQIYYALAGISYKEKDIPGALDLLGKSIKESVSNNTQKALSYLKRADIYFARADYKAAQANYDSTMTFLPTDYPDYALIDAKKKSLTSLVTNLNVISNEDSLQTIGHMSEKDRNAFIDKLIAKVEEEERQKEEEKQNEQQLLQNQLLNPTTPAPNTTTTGAWYFYNPSTVSFGAGEFTKKWGSRKLEDNWRRLDKDQNMALDVEGATSDQDSTDTNGNAVASKDPSKKNKKDRAYYLKKVPLTDDDFAKSNIKIVDAYYNIGSIYKEQLQNYAKSVEAFETLVKRFPENKYKLSSYYQLYRTYMVMNNIPKSDYYKNLLLNDYPETEYAKIIKNPDYAKDIAASKSQVEKFYTETYTLYSDGKYAEALANCNKADSMYAKSYLMPQFSFVKALCIGRTQDINDFESALTQVTIKYPKEPVKDKAQEMLDMIKRQKSGVTTVDTAAVEQKPKFVFNEKGDYYWVLIVANGKGDVNKFKEALADMNNEAFSTVDLEISSVFLDLGHQLVSVKTFDGKLKAMDYFTYVKAKPETFNNLEAGTYQMFVISADNFSIFYKQKNVDEYQQFFTQNFKQ